MPAVKAPGLPNIIGSAFNGYTCNNDVEVSGALSYTPYGEGISANVGREGLKLEIDASRSSSVYGKSDTVQPPALQLIPQIKF